MLGRYLKRNEIRGNDGALAVGRAGRNPLIGHGLGPVDPIRQELLAARAHWRWTEIRAHILPDDLSIAGHLEQAAVHSFVDKCVAIGQSAGTADEGTVETPLRAI